MDENPVSNRQRAVNLSSGQLSLLMNQEGSLGELSPLMGMENAAPAEGDRELLLREGIIGPQGSPLPPWDRVAKVLAGPAMQLTIAVGNADGLGTLHAYGRRSDPDLIAYTAVGEGEHRISFPLNTSQLTGYLAAGLGLTAQVAPLGLSFELSPEALLALTGLMDARREQYLDSLVARQTEEDSVLWPAAVVLSLRKGVLSDDFRWLASMMWRVLPFAVEVQEAAVRAGLSELAEKGLTAGGPSGGIIMNDELEAIRPHLSSPLAFGVVSLVRLGDDGLERLHLGLIRSLASLWSVDFIPGQPWTTRLSSVSSLELAGIVENTLEAVLKMEPSQETGQKLFCSQCGQALAQGDRFCVACGAAASQ